jgi:hypothetical protein
LTPLTKIGIRYIAIKFKYINQFKPKSGATISFSDPRWVCKPSVVILFVNRLRIVPIGCEQFAAGPVKTLCDQHDLVDLEGKSGNLGKCSIALDLLCK